MFGVKNQIGLSSILTGTTEEDCIVQVPGEGLSIIASGPIPPAPAELLGSNMMKSLIERMAQRFDFVLLDSAPVQNVTDSLVLSQYVDGTIVVVRAGQTTNENLESGMRKLRDVHARFLGFVLNGMKEKDSGKYYYYGYSSYYASEEKEA
jgi:capsular exopolysaccharide synthesis family protein